MAGVEQIRSVDFWTVEICFGRFYALLTPPFASSSHWSALSAGGFDSRHFFVTSLLIVLGFRFYVKNSFLAVDGSRTNSKCGFWTVEICFGRFYALLTPPFASSSHLVGALCGRVRLPNFYLLRRDLLVSRFVFSGKILSAVDGSRTNSRCCFWDCRNLFWEVLCPFYPFVRLILPLVGAHFGRVQLLASFVTILLFVLGFSFYGNFFSSGRRESNPRVRLGKRA